MVGGLTPGQVAQMIVLPILWIGWLAYWALSARNVKQTAWQESAAAQMVHKTPLLLAALLMGGPRLVPSALSRRFLPVGNLFPVLGTALVALGLAFAIWARRHLGRNWSAHVVVKEGHALVRTGPYRRVRHPIYTGILLAFLGTALAIGEWRALLAVPLAILSFVLKSRDEEERMRATFPEYESYERETKALVPFVY
jgi:protein-S-isoprenylcysteine O-methyltransferase Ste14